MKSVFANDRLRISITDNCNFQCKYCTNEGQVHNKGNFIDMDFVKRLVKYIIDNQLYVRKLNITGGEPLLHPELVKIIEIFKKAAESITLNTNGELLNKEKIVNLKSAGISCIKFGIDSFFKKTTKPFIRQCNCHPPKIIENFFYSQEILPRSSINIVLTDFTINEFEDILIFCISNNINLVEFLELIKFDFRKNKIPIPSGVSFATIFSTYRSYFTEISYNLRIGKYYCKTDNGQIFQFADDFCKSRLCKNLWTRIDSLGCFIPCIKAPDRIKIDFDLFLDQIKINNRLMCDGSISKRIVRDYNGDLLPENIQGDYLPSYVNVLEENNILSSELDL